MCENRTVKGYHLRKFSFVKHAILNMFRKKYRESCEVCSNLINNY